MRCRGKVNARLGKAFPLANADVPCNERAMEAELRIYRAIMVSSTFTDLEAHRREVIDAIHRFGFHANVMEYSGARSDSDVIETSLEMVR